MASFDRLIVDPRPVRPAQKWGQCGRRDNRARAALTFATTFFRTGGRVLAQQVEQALHGVGMECVDSPLTRMRVTFSATVQLKEVPIENESSGKVQKIQNLAPLSAAMRLKTCRTVVPSRVCVILLPPVGAASTDFRRLNFIDLTTA